MKTLVSVIVVVILTGHGAAAQSPAPATQGRQTTPTPSVPPRPVPARDPAVEAGQLVNVKIDLAVIEEGGADPVSRKEVSVTVADRRSGVVRSAAVTLDPKDRHQGEVSADVRPWLERNGKIRTLVTMNYVSHPHFSNWGQLKFEPLLDSGKPLVVSQASSAVSDRRMRVEVTATILK